MRAYVCLCVCACSVRRGRGVWRRGAQGCLETGSQTLLWREEVGKAWGEGGGGRTECHEQQDLGMGIPGFSWWVWLSGCGLVNPGKQQTEHLFPLLPGEL